MGFTDSLARIVRLGLTINREFPGDQRQEQGL